jgi:hypothetical protein
LAHAEPSSNSTREREREREGERKAANRSPEGGTGIELEAAERETDAVALADWEPETTVALALALALSVAVAVKAAAAGARSARSFSLTEPAGRSMYSSPASDASRATLHEINAKKKARNSCAETGLPCRNGHNSPHHEQNRRQQPDRDSSTA